MSKYVWIDDRLDELDEEAQAFYMLYLRISAARANPAGFIDRDLVMLDIMDDRPLREWADDPAVWKHAMSLRALLKGGFVHMLPHYEPDGPPCPCIPPKTRARLHKQKRSGFWFHEFKTLQLVK